MIEYSIPISDVQVRLIENGSDGLIAWASCVIAGGIKLNNIAIRRGRDRSLFLTYPTKRTPQGDKHHYHHPITPAAAKAIQDSILTQLAALAKAAQTTMETVS